MFFRWLLEKNPQASVNLNLAAPLKAIGNYLPACGNNPPKSSKGRVGGLQVQVDYVIGFYKRLSKTTEIQK